ncbi:hypothetical protein NV379_02045 [Paenibacillus sp. N1-5-1-14]|uniref:hypothetical protein n=1 Tax=Paenibacillus radicibacter TaxID=2972488 RepID=UPI002158D535|nr:hypothetical protein [Paenibacillus radicibacter]MCR8641427.1 hypothetical protein [Paenibacillus radicibacter]
MFAEILELLADETRISFKGGAKLKHFRSHWIIYTFAFLTLFLSILFPEFKIEVSGGFAWFTFLIAQFVGLLMIYTGLCGGEVTYQSNGLIPIVKELITKLKNSR